MESRLWRAQTHACQWAHPANDGTPRVAFECEAPHSVRAVAEWAEQAHDRDGWRAPRLRGESTELDQTNPICWKCGHPHAKQTRATRIDRNKSTVHEVSLSMRNESAWTRKFLLKRGKRLKWCILVKKINYILISNKKEDMFKVYFDIPPTWPKPNDFSKPALNP